MISVLTGIPAIADTVGCIAAAVGSIRSIWISNIVTIWSRGPAVRAACPTIIVIAACSIIVSCIVVVGPSTRVIAVFPIRATNWTSLSWSGQPSRNALQMKRVTFIFDFSDENLLVDNNIMTDRVSFHFVNFIFDCYESRKEEEEDWQKNVNKTGAWESRHMA